MNTEVLLAKTVRAMKFRTQNSEPRAQNFKSGIDGEISLFLRRVAKPAKKNELVPQIFERIVGDSLAGNCKIKSLTAGVMKIKVNPGPYMFELRCRAGQIIEDLKQQCPSSNIREIRLVCAE